MRILSNSGGYQHTVRGEEIGQAQDNRGVLRSYVIQSEIILKFTQSGITGYEYEFGLRHWMRGQTDPLDRFSSPAWGAHAVAADDLIDHRVVTAWHPAQNFSVYDSSWEGDPERRAAIEEYFTTHPEGQNWIVVTKMALTPPWPTYDSMHAAKIAPMAAELGLVAEALSYEQAQDEPRESVVAALVKKLEEAREQAAEDAALNVVTRA